jgi:hypothetical protein
MSARNVLRTTLDEFAREAGFTKKAGSWCRRQSETIEVLELQKSQFGHQYFVNIAVWLLQLGDTECPKEHACHLRSRITRLLPQHQDQLGQILDLDDASVTDAVRREMFKAILEGGLGPLLDRCSTLDGIRSLEPSGVLRSFLIAGPAQRILQLTEL